MPSNKDEPRVPQEPLPGPSSRVDDIMSESGQSGAPSRVSDMEVDQSSLPATDVDSNSQETSPAGISSFWQLPSRYQRREEEKYVFIVINPGREKPQTPGTFVTTVTDAFREEGDDLAIFCEGEKDLSQILARTPSGLYKEVTFTLNLDQKISRVMAKNWNMRTETTTKIVGEELRSIFESVNFCRVNGFPEEANAIVQTGKIDFIDGNHNHMFLKIDNEFVVLPLSRLIMFPFETFPLTLKMFTVALEVPARWQDSPLHRFALYAYTKRLPEDLTCRFLNDWNDHDKEGHPEKIDDHVDPDSYECVESSADGAMVVGSLIYSPNQMGIRSCHLLVEFAFYSDYMVQYASVPSTVKLHIIKDNSITPFEISNHSDYFYVECLASVRIDSEHFPLFPGYIATEVVVGKHEHLFNYSLCFIDAGCSPNLREWRTAIAKSWHGVRIAMSDEGEEAEQES